MIAALIPPFDLHRVIVEPWQRDNVHLTLWIVLLGFFISAACGLLGNYLLLRRMALAGDAISHSVLPGLVAAYVLFETLDAWAMVLGAAVAGVAAVVLIEFIQGRSKVKSDAATGIAFTSLFALGILLIGKFASRAHLDVDCVLYGALETAVFQTISLPIPLPAWFAPNGMFPQPVLMMGAICLLVAILVTLFYKELLVTSFDPALAVTLGMRSRVVHYVLMAVVSVVIVAALESVGAVLVVGMIILPPATARFFSDRLPTLLWLSVVFALLGAVSGFHLGQWWNCPLAAAMAVASGAIFFLVWLVRIVRLLAQRLA